MVMNIEEEIKKIRDRKALEYTNRAVRKVTGYILVTLISGIAFIVYDIVY